MTTSLGRGFGSAFKVPRTGEDLRLGEPKDKGAIHDLGRFHELIAGRASGTDAAEEDMPLHGFGKFLLARIWQLQSGQNVDRIFPPTADKRDRFEGLSRAYLRYVKQQHCARGVLARRYGLSEDVPDRRIAEFILTSEWEGVLRLRESRLQSMVDSHALMFGAHPERDVHLEMKKAFAKHLQQVIRYVVKTGLTGVLYQMLANLRSEQGPEFVFCGVVECCLEKSCIACLKTAYLAQKSLEPISFKERFMGILTEQLCCMHRLERPNPLFFNEEFIEFCFTDLKGVLGTLYEHVFYEDKEPYAVMHQLLALLAANKERLTKEDREAFLCKVRKAMMTDEIMALIMRVYGELTGLFAAEGDSSFQGLFCAKCIEAGVESMSETERLIDMVLAKPELERCIPREGKHSFGYILHELVAALDDQAEYLELLLNKEGFMERVSIRGGEYSLMASYQKARQERCEPNIRTIRTWLEAKGYSLDVDG